MSIEIENGVVKMGKYYYDIACIAVKNLITNKVTINFSSSVKIPFKDTFGKIMTREFNLPEENHNDPRKHLTHFYVTRQDILKQSLIITLAQM